LTKAFEKDVDFLTSGRHNCFMNNIKTDNNKKPGQVRDAIIGALRESNRPLTIREIEDAVHLRIGETSSSSVRSYLNLNTPDTFHRKSKGVYALSDNNAQIVAFMDTNRGKRSVSESCHIGAGTIHNDDCFEWLAERSPNSIEAIVTDPPYSVLEYSETQTDKLRKGKGGVWRIPPAFDGHKRSPLPRFTTLTPNQKNDLQAFFFEWGKRIFPVLVPGANVIVAANPLLSALVSNALANAGLERRGEIIRLVMTMRGGDRPKNAHDEFPGVSVMPRSMWEPWLVFRKPIEGRVQDNLRKWGTGGFKRISDSKPFGDVIQSSPTPKKEKEIAKHPSLKPQDFLRRVVRASLPLGRGTILDPFCGAGSTIAAANNVGYDSIGIEKDKIYYNIAKRAVDQLSSL
jgi:site-specific DNA-methyltransferase (adenine-specific)